MRAGLPSPLNRPVNLTEAIVTTGNLLYLLMCLAMFGSFSAMLAWVSWQQPGRGPDTIIEKPAEPETNRALAV